MTYYKVLGLMSGTSMDGLDMAYCEFALQQGQWRFEIANAQTIPYPESLWRQLNACTTLGAEELAKLDLALGRWYGRQCAEWVAETGIAPTLVCSHGHTVFHQPDIGLTCQIGNGMEIHRQCLLPVVNNFRQLDVSLGGHGAPLVPIGDKLLFDQYDFCLNLGGIANVSGEHNGVRRAFDIGPANMALNFLARKTGRAYDDKGALGRSGRVLPGLLKTLDALPYYAQHPPKSLGYEWVKENVLALLESHQAAPADLMHTLAKHIAGQIAQSLTAHFSLGDSPKTMLATGGGVYNDFLMDEIQLACGDRVRLVRPPESIVDFKEALVFAFLGVLKARREANTLSSVTGAAHDSSGGVVHDGLTA